MFNIEDYEIPQILFSARRDRDSTLLIDFIRTGGTITPEIRALLVDVLEGKIKVRPKPQKPAYLNQGHMRYQIQITRTLLTGESGMSGEEIRQWINFIGLKKVPESKGEITKAAEITVCKMYKITQAQLDEILRPRNARKKA